MMLQSSQSMHTSDPLATSTVRRVFDISRASNSVSSSQSEEKNKAAERAQEQSERRMVSELQARDREVRAHEAAHVAAGGSLVISGPSFTYQRGPDGRSYAIGGKVQLDVSPVPNDPEATLQKSEKVRRAALAPVEPSAQDMRVASSANQMAAKARIDIAIQRREETMEANEERLEQERQGLNEANMPPGETNAGLQQPANRADSLQVQSTPQSEGVNAFRSTARSESPSQFSQMV